MSQIFANTCEHKYLRQQQEPRHIFISRYIKCFLECAEFGKEPLHHSPAHFPGHWMHSLIWQILPLTVLSHLILLTFLLSLRILCREGERMHFFPSSKQNTVSDSKISLPNEIICCPPYSLWPAYFCCGRKKLQVRSPVRGNTWTSRKCRAYWVRWSSALPMACSRGPGCAPFPEGCPAWNCGCTINGTIFWRCAFTGGESPVVLLLLLEPLLLGCSAVPGMPLKLRRCRKELWSVSDCCIPLIKQYIVLTINVRLIYSLKTLAG